MKIKFNKEFIWGTAISGPQSEGSEDKANKSIMDYWFETEPQDFHDGVGPEKTSLLYKNYPKIISMMVDLKLNSYRTSIQWTRLIKNYDTCEVDEKAVAFYRDYFIQLKNKNIRTIINLFHFDMPIELQNIGGWTSREVVEKFVQYSEKCFDLFGDLIDEWTTFNEPIVPIELGYLYGVHYPKISDTKQAIQATHFTILAHAKVVNKFREKFSSQPQKKIGVVLNLTPTYPKNSDPENVKAAELRNLTHNKAFLDTMIFGKYPKELVQLLKKENELPEYLTTDLEEISKAKIDFLGINYYQPCRVQAPSAGATSFMEKLFAGYEWPERRINPYRGWEIHPKTIYNIGKNIQENYNNIPWFISENGMGVEGEDKFRNKEGYINDDYRIDFIKEHLYWLNKTIEEGSNCYGYHLWSLVDNWSWNNAYKNRYGFIEYNLDTEKYLVKSSGYWIKEVILQEGLVEIDDEKVKAYGNN